MHAAQKIATRIYISNLNNVQRSRHIPRSSGADLLPTLVCLCLFCPTHHTSALMQGKRQVCTLAAQVIFRTMQGRISTGEGWPSKKKKDKSPGCAPLKSSTQYVLGKIYTSLLSFCQNNAKKRKEQIQVAKKQNKKRVPQLQRVLVSKHQTTAFQSSNLSGNKFLGHFSRLPYPQVGVKKIAPSIAASCHVSDCLEDLSATHKKRPAASLLPPRVFAWNAEKKGTQNRAACGVRQWLSSCGITKCRDLCKWCPFQSGYCALSRPNQITAKHYPRNGHR